MGTLLVVGTFAAIVGYYMGSVITDSLREKAKDKNSDT